MKTEIISFLFMLIFILADLITGLIYAKISKTYKSSIIVLLFFISSGYMSLVQPSVNVVDMFNLTECSSVYIIVNEIGSIKENLDNIRNI